MRKRPSCRRIKARFLNGRNIPLKDVVDRDLMAWINRQYVERDVQRDLLRKTDPLAY